MIEAIAIVLLALWLAGMLWGQTFGGMLHACIAATSVLFLLSVFTKRSTTAGESRK